MLWSGGREPFQGFPTYFKTILFFYFLTFVDAECCGGLSEVWLAKTVINPSSSSQAVLTFVKCSPQGHVLVAKLVTAETLRKRFAIDLPVVMTRFISAIDQANSSGRHQIGDCLVFV